MKAKTVNAKISAYEWRNGSINGNPCYNLTLTTETGETINARTATDSLCAYGVRGCNPEKMRVIEYHTTRTGSNIVDYIKF